MEVESRVEVGGESGMDEFEVRVEGLKRGFG